MLVSAVRNYAADGLSNAPLGDWYETTNGGPEGFRARPVVGGHLALVRATILCLTVVIYADYRRSACLITTALFTH